MKHNTAVFVTTVLVIILTCMCSKTVLDPKPIHIKEQTISKPNKDGIDIKVDTSIVEIHHNITI